MFKSYYWSARYWKARFWRGDSIVTPTTNTTLDFIELASQLVRAVGLSSQSSKRAAAGYGVGTFLTQKSGLLTRTALANTYIGKPLPLQTEL